MPRLCPICRRTFEFDLAARPIPRFCSERCRLIDLGNWLSGSYALTAPVSEADLDEGLESLAAHGRRQEGGRGGGDGHEDA